MCAAARRRPKTLIEGCTGDPNVANLCGGALIFECERNLVSPAGMVETPRLQAKRRAW